VCGLLLARIWQLGERGVAALADEDLLLVCRRRSCPRCRKSRSDSRARDPSSR
jgi:hypothetical protein